MNSLLILSSLSVLPNVNYFIKWQFRNLDLFSSSEFLTLSLRGFEAKAKDFKFEFLFFVKVDNG